MGRAPAEDLEDDDGVVGCQGAPGLADDGGRSDAPFQAHILRKRKFAHCQAGPAVCRAGSVVCQANDWCLPSQILSAGPSETPCACITVHTG